MKYKSLVVVAAGGCGLAMIASWTAAGARAPVPSRWVRTNALTQVTTHAPVKPATNLVVITTNQVAALKTNATDKASSTNKPAAKPPPPKLTRGPYLQMGTPSNLVVRWRTDLPATSKLRYGAKPGKLDQNASAPGEHTEHVVRLTGLKADTKYFYALGSAEHSLAGGDDKYFFITSPPDGARRPVRVWVLGDPGTKTKNQERVRDAYYKYAGELRTDLVLLLGDNAYTSGTDKEYQPSIFDPYRQILRNVVLWPTLGNHDGGSASSATQSGVYYDIFTLPTQGQCGGVMSGTEAYYSFDYANIHFVCLDSHDSDRSPKGAMASWLRRDLATNRNDWAVCFFHHPPYTRGSHDSDDDKDSEGRMKEMRQNIVPILEAGGVDLVLAGHSHTYERSWLLDGHYGKVRTFDLAMRKSEGDGRLDGSGPFFKPALGPVPHAGAVYIVAGSSGQTNSPPKKKDGATNSVDKATNSVATATNLAVNATQAVTPTATNKVELAKAKPDAPRKTAGAKSGATKSVKRADGTPVEEEQEEIDDERERRAAAAAASAQKSGEKKPAEKPEKDLGKLNHPAHFFSVNTLGSLVLEFDRQRLDVTFLDVQGTRRDYFTIIKVAPFLPATAPSGLK